MATVLQRLGLILLFVTNRIELQLWIDSGSQLSYNHLGTTYSIVDHRASLSNAIFYRSGSSANPVRRVLNPRGLSSIAYTDGDIAGARPISLLESIRDSEWRN